MEENLEKLKIVWKNLKKSPGRKYTGKTISTKLEQIERIRNDFQSSELEEEENLELTALKLEFNSLYKLIEKYLMDSEKEQSEVKSIEMASFSLETVSKALPLFTGNHEELESFIITAELIEKTLTETAKQDFLQYVYHAKLTSNVRTAIGSYAKPENFATLKILLSERYKNTRTIPELQSKLSTIYQGKLNINSYKENISKLIDDMNRLGIKELGTSATEAEKNVIIRINNKLALDTFKKGLRDSYKPTIYAARPTTLQEATELALELENEQKLTNNSIMRIHNQQINGNRYNFNRNNNFSNRNGNFPNRSNYFPNNNNNNNNNNYNSKNNYRPNNNTTEATDYQIQITTIGTKTSMSTTEEISVIQTDTPITTTTIEDMSMR